MSTADDLRCWRCGGELAAVALPIPRNAECPHCTVDLHCCRLCVFFDPGARRGCKEPVADEVRERERANFCGYFTPHANVGGAAQKASADPALTALFGLDGPVGGSPADGAAAKSELDRLFGLDDDQT